MSVKVMGKVWDLDLPHNKLIVLLAMADHADHEGNNVFPSQGLIAWKTGYSIDQVRRIQRALVNDKLLKVESSAPGKPIKYSIDLTMGKLKPAYTPGIAMQDLAKSKTLHNDAATTPSIAMQDPTPSIAMQDKPSDKPSIETTTIGVGDVFRFYEDMVGSMTGYMVDVLKDAIETYSGEWLIDAMKIAIEGNHRNWKYTEGILKKWKQNGKDTKPTPSKKSDIPMINGNVVYIEATNQTMIWNADKSGWETYDGKHESRPA